MVPHLAGLDYAVGVSECREPESFVETQFGVVVVEFTAQYSFETNSVREREYRVLGGYRVAVPFVLYELLFWGIAQTKLYLGACDIVHISACGFAAGGLCALELYELAGNVHPVAQGYVEREVVVELFRICQFGLSYITNLVVLLSLEAYEEVVLVGVEIDLAILVYVVLIVQAQRVYRELVGVLLFFLKEYSTSPIYFNFLSLVPYAR